MKRLFALLCLFALPSALTAQNIWHPKPGTSWQIQFAGDINTTVDASMYDIDLFETPQSTIDALHAAHRIVICYTSIGSYENYRPDAAKFPPALLGLSNGWPGEKWLDIRGLDQLKPIFAARLDLAVSKHCGGVDPDNMDGYTNKTGFPLTAADQLTYNRWFATQAHARHLAVGLKNDIAQAKDLVADFDFEINEQCQQYHECDTLKPFIDAGKPVFAIEYNGDPTRVCAQSNALNFDTLIKHLKLDAWRQPCRK